MDCGRDGRLCWGRLNHGRTCGFCGGEINHGRHGWHGKGRLVGFVGEFEQEVTNRLRPNGYEGQEGTKVGTAGLCWGRGNHGPYFAARATKGKQHGRHGKGTL